eukprot:760749-Hanusia_phi.AAC.4
MALCEGKEREKKWEGGERRGGARGQRVDRARRIMLGEMKGLFPCRAERKQRGKRRGEGERLIERGYDTTIRVEHSGTE